MKQNKDILNEAFFKKTTYSEKFKKGLPQYEPASNKSKPGFGSQFALGKNEPSLAVTDTDEVKKRLANVFGATFGNNSIKSMASRSIKTFPILVSDNLEPDTCVMLKKLMEDQYAEYINLLVSNQIVDLSVYTTDGTNGNIAIQALDTLSGSEFGSAKTADKISNRGSVAMDDVFGNIPLYNLLRENQLAISTGDSLTDRILENALIVPNENVNKLVKYIRENADNIDILNDTYIESLLTEDPTPRVDTLSKTTRLDDYFNSRFNSDFAKYDYTQNVATKDMNYDAIRGLVGVNDNGEEVYNKLTNTQVLVDSKNMDKIMNRTVGEMLIDPANKIIRDKFEKATFLLESGAIAGTEYINYITIRLGIPITQRTRTEIVNRFKIKDVRRDTEYSVDKNGNLEVIIDSKYNQFSKDIANNRKIVNSALSSSLSLPVKIAIGAISATTGIAVGAISTFFMSPLIAPIAATAIVGAGSYLIAKLVKKYLVKKDIETANSKIQGWERVEALIEQMERNRDEVVMKVYKREEFKKQKEEINSNKYDVLAQTKIKTDISKNIEDAEVAFKLDNIKVDLDNLIKNSALRESFNFEKTEIYSPVLKEDLELFYKTLSETYNECMKDSDFVNQHLSEDLTTAMPIKTQYIMKKPDKDVLIAPAYSVRSNYAYGSTEIERKENKDRRYNQPLIMTVKFKERFSDGKFSDNELTAVIGILGKIIRIPSEEMKYILRANANGETIRGVFADGGNAKNLISDLLSTSKISKDIKALPQSADIWKNLEKVASLAASNAISGKKNNNISNAHIIFSQKEIDELRSEDGIDYLKNVKLAANLMKRYSAFTIMVANDAGQRVYVYDDLDNINWDVVPYSALMGKDTGDQLTAALAKLGRLG